MRQALKPLREWDMVAEPTVSDRYPEAKGWQKGQGIRDPTASIRTCSSTSFILNLLAPSPRSRNS